MKSPVEVRRLTTPQDVFHAAAEEVVRAANEAVAERGRFVIALSGGSTPKSLYTLLATNARSALPWAQMFFFWSDERHVPPTDPDSNYGMAQEAMLSRVPVPAGTVFRVPAGKPEAADAALAYERILHQFFSLPAAEIPRFDLILLGLGPDGHTASLFPETAALAAKSRLVVAHWGEKL